MATYTATRGAANFPVAGHGFAGNKKQAWATYYSTTTSLLAGDIIRMVRLPKGAIVTGGRFFGSTLETSTSGAALDIDVGYEANGVDTVDSDAFGNLGVLNSAARAGDKPEALTYSYPLGGVLLTAGPKTLGAETIIGLTVVASALAWVSGTLGLVVDYEMP
jgi:hypothetical protein